MQIDHTINQSHVQLSNRRPARAQAVSNQPDYQPHDHEFYEICIVTSGLARHRTAEGDTQLQRGSVIIVAPGQVHEFAKTQNFSVVNVYYLAEWFLVNIHALQSVDGLVPLFFQRALFPSRNRQGAVCFQMIEAELVSCLRDLDDMEAEGRSGAAQPLFLEAALLKCLIRLTRASARAGVLPEEKHWPAAVGRGLAAIEENVRTGNPLSVRTLAKESGASFSHFCRVFKAATGVTPGTYFQRRRIHRACRRLLSTEDSTTGIAHALGFSDSAHFSRRFKEMTGMPPQKYREKFTGSKPLTP